jgi:PAS domain S-box-containing protein
MTIERRAKLTAGVLLLFVLVTGAILFWSSRQVEDGLKRIETTSQVVESAFMLNVLMEDYVHHGGQRPLRQWHRYHEVLGQMLSREESFEAVHRPMLEDVRHSYQVVTTLSPQVMALDQTTESEGLPQVREMLTGLMSLRLEQLVNAAIELNTATQSLTLKKRKFVQWLITSTAVSMVVIILINIYLIRKSVVRPLKVLSAGAERVREGNFDTLMELESDDEVGKLTQAFNSMIEGLRDRTKALKEAHRELEQRVQERTAELELANDRLILEAKELERAQQAVAAERQRLYGVLETLPVYVCLLDSDYHMPFANRYFRETFGESQGRRCHEFLFDRTEPCEICESYTVMKTRSPHHWYWTGPNGRDYDIYDFPFTDNDGSFMILEMGIDITERKRAEEALLAASAYNRSLIEASLDPLVTISAEGKITDVNKATERVTGYSRNELIGTDFANYFTDTEEATFGYQQVFRDGSVKNYELAIRHKRGRVTPVMYNSSVYRDESGKVLGIFAAARDITDRKRAEEALIRSNEDLQQFAYVASHDLQEPLRNVTSCMQMLEKGYKNKLGPEADQYIYYAVDSALRMKALIQDLLTYSRVGTSGKLPQPTDCGQVLDQTVKNLGHTLSETGAVITHDPLPTIVADGTQLLQVFQNLIGNALKFRGEEPARVHVSAVKNEREWTFSVKDNGIGIEPRHLERIFLIFQRLHKRTAYDGTGMGLAIVKKIIERHHGRIWVESEPGKGTTFYFTIP